MHTGLRPPTVISRVLAHIQKLGARTSVAWTLWGPTLVGHPSPPPSHVAIGKAGERIAEKYLKRKGFRIITRNFRAAGAEIDLIAMDHQCLAFIEVKRRIDTYAGMPEDAVDRHKQDQIRRAAEIFAERYRAGERPMRFDVIAISGPDGTLEHFKDAF